METIYKPKIKTDLTVRRDGVVRISSNLARKLKAKAGDVLELVRDGVEVMLTVGEHNEGVVSGKLLKASQYGETLQFNSTNFAKSIINETDTIGKYRTGDVVTINNRIYVPIITRKNYANQTDNP